MAAKKSRQRRVESLLESEGDFPVRRSPRLSSRNTPRERAFPLIAPSRPSLPSYEKEQMKNRKVMNESGQSILEDEEEVELGKVSHDHTYAQKSATGEPTHLYGLDDSDNELVPEPEVQKRKYRVFDTVRTLKTPPRPESAQQLGPTAEGVLKWVRGVAYKIVSLVYLVPSAAVCLDVLTLHKMSRSVHQLAPSDAHFQLRSRFSFLLLPVVLGLLVMLLAGGNYISAHHEQMEEIVVTLPNTIATKGEEELAQILKRLNATILSHVSSYLSNYKEQLLAHLETQAERLVSARDFNRWFELKNQLSEETKARELFADELRTQLIQAIEERITAVVSSVVRNISELDDRLKQVQQSAVDHRAELSNVINSNTEVTKNHQEEALKASRSAWLKESEEHMTVELEKLKEQMKGEMDAILQRTDAAHVQGREDLKLLHSTSAILASRLEQLEHTVQAYLQSNTSDYSSVVAVVHAELKAMLKDHSSLLHPLLSDSIAASKYGVELGKRIAQLESAVSKASLSSSDPSDVRVKELIRESLVRYSADKIGKFDFALESAGATVVVKQCSPTYAPSQSSVSLFGMPLFYYKNPPNAVIQPQVYPGDCWAFEGTKGHVVIKLVTKAFIDGVTIEHIPKELSLNNSRASSPKDFSVWGMQQDEDEGKLIGSFTYSLDGDPIQEFPIYDTQEPYTHVKFQFLSNHGNPEYTCVYRVRVHGYLPPPQ